MDRVSLVHTRVCLAAFWQILREMKSWVRDGRMLRCKREGLHTDMGADYMLHWIWKFQPNCDLFVRGETDACHQSKPCKGCMVRRDEQPVTWPRAWPRAFSTNRVVCSREIISDRDTSASRNFLSMPLFRNITLKNYVCQIHLFAMFMNAPWWS